MRKHRYEQSVRERNKWHSLIKTVVGRNFTVLSKNNYIQSGLNTKKL